MISKCVNILFRSEYDSFTLWTLEPWRKLNIKKDYFRAQGITQITQSGKRCLAKDVGKRDFLQLLLKKKLIHKNSNQFLSMNPSGRELKKHSLSREGKSTHIFESGFFNCSLLSGCSVILVIIISW